VKEYSNISDALRVYRNQRNLLQKEVAYDLGISQEYYRKIETGRKPSINIMNKIRDKLGIKVYYTIE